MIDSEDLVAGALCLDFINTVGGIRVGVHNDKLETYQDLLELAVLGNAVTRSHANALALIARRRPEMAATTLADGKALREALHAIFSAALTDRAPNRQAFGFVNQRLGQALAHARIKGGPAKHEWTWEPPEMLDAPLWPIVHNAGELLVSDSLGRLQECASDTCGWFFLDLTKNRSRRWCAMSGCGNRHKVRRFRDKLPKPGV
jgi:predicted RNA-binding Zn ribbon-like protein